MANPAAPTKAVWTLIRSNRPSPRCPTTDIASSRTRPPVISTVIPGDPASSEAMRRPLVMTVSWLQPPWDCGCAGRPRGRWCWRPSRSSRRRGRGPRPRRRCAPSRPAAGARGGRRPAPAGRGPGASAPPWVRVSRPSPSRTSRSLRMVTVETPYRSARSRTRTRPCSLDEAGDLVLAFAGEDIAGRGAGRDGQTKSPVGPVRGDGGVSGWCRRILSRSDPQCQETRLKSFETCGRLETDTRWFGRLRPRPGRRATMSAPPSSSPGPAEIDGHEPLPSDRRPARRRRDAGPRRRT